MRKVSKVFRHRRACVIATMVAFTLIKTWAPATAACEHVLGWFLGPVMIIRDPTDLIALPFALWAWPGLLRDRGEEQLHRAIERQAQAFPLAAKMPEARDHEATARHDERVLTARAVHEVRVGR